MTHTPLPPLESFAEHTESEFTVHGSADTASTLTLETVDTERDTVPDWERFSLVFRASDTSLVGGRYRLDHPALGSFEAALVPVWVGDPTVPGYEAVVERPVHGRDPTHRPVGASRRGFLGRALAVAVAGTLLGGVASAEPPRPTPSVAGLSAEPLLGSVGIFAGNFAPRGWALCNGQLLQISQNQALFAILGTTYGGDGRTTFALPDLRGRAPVGTGQGPGLSQYQLGQRGGTEQVTLAEDELPAHTHDGRVAIDHDLHLPVTDREGGVTTPTGHVLAGQGGGIAHAFRRGSPLGPIYSDETPDGQMALGGHIGGDITTTATGGGGTHENRPPYLALNYVIALQGLFPSRN